MNKTPTKSKTTLEERFEMCFSDSHVLSGYTAIASGQRRGVLDFVKAEVSLALRRREEILESNIVRAEDIMEDVDMIPEAKNDGRLLGIKSVAGSIRDSLKSLSSQDK